VSATAVPLLQSKQCRREAEVLHQLLNERQEARGRAEGVASRSTAVEVFSPRRHQAIRSLGPETIIAELTAADVFLHAH